MVKKIREKRLVLLDTHAIVHRAYHALPDFMNSKGEPTGALYGLATMLFKIITDLKPDYIIACYDLPKKTFRHEVYKEYKAGRAKSDEALISQIIKSYDFFKALNIPIYKKEGFEADDILGTITEKTKNKKNLNLIIASGDMDTLQLVKDDKVCVYTLKKGINNTILYNEKAVLDRFGFKPEFLPDYKGLRGDPSDNIIGIKGIGEKTATTLVCAFNTLEKLFKELKKNSDNIKKLGITDRIVNLLKEGEEEALFSKTLATIRRDAPIDFKIPEKTWRESINVDNVTEFFRGLEFKSLQNRFLNLFENKNEEVRLPNIRKSDFLIQKAKIAFWLLNSEMVNPSEDDIINYKNSKSVDEAFKKLEEDIKKEGLSYVYKEIEIPIIPIINQMEKNGIAVDNKYFKKLSKDYHFELNKLEKNIWKQAGREFNINSPKQLGEVIFDELKIHEKGKGLRMKKTAGGARSTRESELEKMRELHPIIEEILKYRELQKLLSTYIDPIPEMVGDDGRLHATFLQTGTTTGRFSSNNPNLQNIPVKSELGKNIRNAFISEPNYILASFDYSQIELRIAALLSQDSYFIKVFKDNKDIHTAVAMKVFKVKEEDVTAEMRRHAKIINFGILYGMGVTALRQNLGGTRAEAQKFFDNYFAQFPTIAEYLESIKDFAKKNGYTETLFKRRRYFPGINSPVPFIKAMAERMATNAPIQGTATADIIKIGMKKVQEALAKEGLDKKVKIILQVHDELIYEIKKGYEKKVVEIIQNTMENVVPEEFLTDLEPVPLRVSVGLGKSWGKLK